MKKVLISVLLTCSVLQAGRRDLIILLDDKTETIEKTFQNPDCLGGQQDQGMGPTTGALVAAIAQKAAPILVTASVWRNFIARRKMYADFIMHDTATLHGMYQHFPCMKDPKNIETFKNYCLALQSPIMSPLLEQQDTSIRLFIEQFYICHTIPFLAQEWDLRKLTDDFYLLIPKLYAQRLEPIVDNPFTSRVSNEELRLGLKMGKPLQDQFDLAKHPSQIINLSEKFQKLLPNLFVTKFDVRHMTDKQKSEEYQSKYLHQFSILLQGHGSEAAQTRQQIAVIAGLQESVFKYFLRFLNTDIVTAFLMYETCYAGGEHLHKPYEQVFQYPPQVRGGKTQQATVADIFNYVIVASTLFHTVTSSYTSSINFIYRLPDKKIESKRIVHPQEYGIFFLDLGMWLDNSPYNPRKDLALIVNHIHRFIDIRKKELARSFQIPVVRYPGTGWFSVIGIEDKIIRLTKTMVEVHEVEKKPIEIPWHSEAIILETQRLLGRRKQFAGDEHSAIRVPIIIQSKYAMPALFSSAIKPAQYYLEKIEAPSQGLLAVLNAFMQHKDSYYPRTFYIASLRCRIPDIRPDQLQLLGQQNNSFAEFTDVVILNNARNPYDQKDTMRYNGIFFTYNKNSFQAIWPATDARSNQFVQEKLLPNLRSRQGQAVQYPYPDDLAAESKLSPVLLFLLQKKTQTAPPPFVKPALPARDIQPTGKIPAAVQPSKKENVPPVVGSNGQPKPQPVLPKKSPATGQIPPPLPPRDKKDPLVDALNQLAQRLQDLQKVL